MTQTKRFHQVDYRIDGDVAVVTMDNPPVNGLSLGIREGLLEAFSEARNDSRVASIVLCGKGRGFSAGGDINEFGTPAATARPGLSLDVHPHIENSPKPVVAAMHGLAIGGGLETAMVCHYRIAASDTRVGLPELKLGIIPLSGTQRLPRVLGTAKALEMILESKLATAGEFGNYALFDRIVDADAGAVLQVAIAFAGSAGVREAGLPLIRNLPIPDAEPLTLIRAAGESIEQGDYVKRQGLAAIAAGVESASFDEGMAKARKIWDELVRSDYVRQQKENFLKK